MPFRLHFHVLYRILSRIQYITGKIKKQDEEREFLGLFAKGAYPRASLKKAAAGGQEKEEGAFFGFLEKGAPFFASLKKVAGRREGGARGQKNSSHNKKRTASRVVRLLF